MEMDSSHAASSSGGPLTKERKIESSGGGDRLSKLTDHALGHVLSFLPAQEAARAAMLSSRWRHVFAAVHTVFLEEPESPIPDYDNQVCLTPEFQPCPDPNAPPPFYNIVSAAIIARQRRRGAVPLRALRVAVESYRGLRGESLTVDQWVSYAVQQGAAEALDLDLRLQCRSPICERSSDWWSSSVPAEYTATRVIFSCAHLRSLSLGSCRLDAPNTVRLPSLVTLLLSRIPDPGSDVERLVACCPRLADLTIEACSAVTALSIVGGGARLRRLALRCCHNLTAVAVDSSELQAFEYRGYVPCISFLTMHGGSTTIAYCKVDICGKEAILDEEFVNLRQFLQLFVNAKHLHLESARLGSSFDKDVPMASFSSLLHLEMRGCLPDDDDDSAIIAAVSTVLEHAPNLETLSLAFHSQEQDSGDCPDYIYFSEEVVLEAHHLSFNPHSILATPTAMIPCLRSKVREINLVHYQGGNAQRALAKFLLSNAPVIDRLWCEFAEGPMWTQVQLMREIQGWLINKSAETHFA